MKTIFNKALWASAIGACTLSLGSCTDLSETIYDTIASEKYEFTEKDRKCGNLYSLSSSKKA